MKRGINIFKYIVLIFILALWYSNTYAYVACKTDGGADIKWPSGNVTYDINISGTPAGSLAALQAGMQTWTDEPSSNFTFVYGGATTSTVHANDGINVVFFTPLSPGLIAQNGFWYNGSTGEMVDSDIRFNSTLTWATDGSANAMDVENIAAHEFGHTLCLADLYGPNDTEKTMQGHGANGQLIKRTLHYDDVDGINYLYPGSGDDPYEQNDTMSSAYAFHPNDIGEWICDQNGCGIKGDVDWYMIRTYQPRVKINLRFTHAEGDIDMCLYDNVGSQLQCSEDVSDFELIDYVSSSPGDLYLEVDYQSTGNAYDLRWNEFCVPDSYEPDDDSGTASQLISGITQYHNICPATDEDWYIFTVTAESAVTIETSGQFGDTRMWLYDSSLNEIEYDDDGGTGTWSRIDRLCGTNSLSPGTYYVKIDEFENNNEIDYDISLDITPCPCVLDSYEPDDNSTTATTLSSGVPQTHNICPSGDEDWMTFTVTNSSSVVLETSGPIGDTRMWLYDGNLNEIEFDDDDGIGTWSRIDRACGIDALSPGTYYVKIDEFHDLNEIASYDIGLTVTDCPVCGNGILEAGEQCDDGNTVGGDCCSANCQYEPANSPCNDGLYCNEGETCNGTGTCGGGNPVECLGDQCNYGVCNEVADACETQPIPNGTPCDDAQYCTVNDQCVAGVCGGSVRDCSDGIGCTDDSCNEVNDLCENTPNNTNCPEDGLFCNGTEFCDAVNDCSSPGDPCPLGMNCNEITDTCETSGPVPNIKANGLDGPLTITTSDTLSVTIELNAAGNSNSADWWVVADTPFGWNYYNLSTWLPGIVVTYQGALVNLPLYQVLNMTLPAGSYIFYFGVDMNMNGSIDLGQMYYDSVDVTITP